MKTTVFFTREQADQVWHLVDAKDKVLGRIATRVADLLVEWAVRGMLPKTRLGDRLFTKLKVYAGPDHPHEAQCPRPLNVAE